MVMSLHQCVLQEVVLVPLIWPKALHYGAIVLCSKLGFEDVIFKGDAKELIDVIKSKKEDKS